MESGELERVVPRPRVVERAAGTFEWSGHAAVIEPGNDADEFAAQTLLDACRERGLAEPRIVQTQDAPEVGEARQIVIGDPCRHTPLLEAMREGGLELPGEVTDQGYLLLVTPNRILIAANTAAGVFYGVQTLIQLLPEVGASPEAPCLKVVDWPGVARRGVSMDLFSGEVYTMDWFKENIRRLARYKMNCLILYLEDAFLFPSHPDIGEDRDRLTTEEVRELVEFGEQYHVELISCYDSPGHMGNTLGHPNYRYLREGTDTQAQRDVINVSHPDTYPLMRDLYTDLCRAFPSEICYVGGDEAFSIGTGASAELEAKVGKANLFLRHIKMVREVLREHGKRMALAADPFEPGFFKPFGLENYGIEALRQVPRDCIIGPWHYGVLDSFEFGDTLIDMGFEQILWTSCAAYYHLFPEQNAAARNVESFVPYAHRLKALGAIHSDWNGKGENTFSEYNWPGYAFFAEWAWASPGRSWNEGLPAVVESFYGPGTGGLAEVITFLAGIARYFGWAGVGMTPAGFHLFFQPLEPHPMGKFLFAWTDKEGVEHSAIPVEEAREGLDAFRRDLALAREALDAAREAASRDVDHLDYIGFALDQFGILGDMVECRHLMSEDDPQWKDLAIRVRADMRELIERYEELWLRVSRPLGLEPNLVRFRALLGSVEEALAKANVDLAGM